MRETEEMERDSSSYGSVHWEDGQIAGVCQLAAARSKLDWKFQLMISVCKNNRLQIKLSLTLTCRSAL